MLLGYPGEVVTREELQKQLWQADTFVDFDPGLNRAINRLRDALGDAADSPRFVETIPRRGYRFTAPVEIAGEVASVVIGGLEAPLFFVSPGQINAQIPNELVQGNSYDVVVIANSAVTTPQPVQLNLRAPGVARFADGHVIAQHSDFSLVTAQSPAKPGEYLIIYLGGLGPGDQTVTSGSTSPSSPLDAVPDVTITVAGQSATVFFSGLTPGLVGLYQVNFQVPQNVSSGDLMLQVTEDGYAANSGLLTVAH